jgi:hypothetical protein
MEVVTRKLISDKKCPLASSPETTCETYKN